MSTATHHPLAVMFTSRDVKKSIAFYRDVLGFELEQCWPDKEKPMWANLVLDKQSVMLGAMMPPEMAGEMCGGDEGAKQWMKTCSEEFQKNQPGVGIVTYVEVKDVDAYHARLTSKGLKGLTKPRSQFYGLRDFGVQDPDGYRLLFYTLISLEQCQSCGMPLTESKPGQMYCGYCADPAGKLKPYETVFEGTVSGYFMGMQKMSRTDAEKAAREHLSKMPAWVGRK